MIIVHVVNIIIISRSSSSSINMAEITLTSYIMCNLVLLFIGKVYVHVFACLKRIADTLLFLFYGNEPRSLQLAIITSKSNMVSQFQIFYYVNYSDIVFLFLPCYYILPTQVRDQNHPKFRNKSISVSIRCCTCSQTF